MGLIKNLTQVFISGILSGIFLSGFLVGIVTDVWGINWVWASFFIITGTLTSSFYSKLKRCQNEPTDATQP